MHLAYSSPATDGDGDDRRIAASAERNTAPILAVLGRHAPRQGRALELAAGTGQHSVAFAEAFPGLHWQPSDGAADALASIAAWRRVSGLANLAEPVLLDIAEPDWGLRHSGQDLVFVANLLHLISEAEALSVLHGMGQALQPGGTAMVYGPFRRNGALTSEGDRTFDASLRRQDADIGYKDEAWVTGMAAGAGLTLRAAEDMPANNLCLVFGKAG
ncbi:class I SAM-dependent methyltransferase [Acidimangrovimonas sediminis]|uniref:Class I SAM-dependent methyltransferase n=1 Tax=Albidovulum sediminis TaxID=3066345 RepID=A0ABT2NP74_9RHOB|nr:class I SAM-dependent methyltransferase [Defluviimonas sediminis]